LFVRNDFQFVVTQGNIHITGLSTGTRIYFILTEIYNIYNAIKIYMLYEMK